MKINKKLAKQISVSKAEALDSFIEAAGLAQTVARGIDKAMNDNMGWDPDGINWASVGTINHINELLDQVQFAIESSTGSKEWFATEITGSY